MTAVPAAADEILTSPSPIVGSASDPEPVRVYFDELAERMVEARYRSARGGRQLAALAGQGVSKIAQRATGTMVPATEKVGSSAEDARSALEGFMESIGGIHADARAVRADADSSLAKIRAAASRIDEIAREIGVAACYEWETGAPLVMPEPRSGSTKGDSEESGAAGDDEDVNGVGRLRARYEMLWMSEAARWAAGLDTIGSCRARWAGLVEDRRGAERALASALQRTEVGRLIDLGGGEPGAMPAAVASGLSTTRSWEPAEVQALIRGELSPEDVSELWRTLEARGVDTDRLLEDYCFELANLNGLPFAAIDRAGRHALERALSGERGALEEAYRRLGFLPGDMGLDTFAAQLGALRTALDEADSAVRTEEMRTVDVVQLLAFGRHDGAVTGAVSFGDLDTAKSAGVLVSGMRSDVTGISESFDAFRALERQGVGGAMVTWIGYNAPGLLGETVQGHAERGHVPLVEFLDGLSELRLDDPLERLTVVGHSYGSNVVAEALKSVDRPVDAFVALGSAGLRVGTTADQLKVHEIHATHGPGDDIAWIGRGLHFRSHAEDGAGPYAARVDPRGLEGAREFSSAELDEHRGVTMHNLRYPLEWGRAQWLADRLDGTAAADEIGYLHPDSRTVEELRLILEGAY